MKYITAALAFLAALFGLHKHGQRQGKEEAKRQQVERNREIVEKVNEAIKKNADDTVDERRERLRQRINK